MNVTVKPALMVIGILMTCLFILLNEVHDLLLSSKTSFFHRSNSMKLEDMIHNISKSPKLVLILTYMRSGSSLTGDILQQSPGAFYVYEPLRAIGSRKRSSYNILYANGTIRKPPFDFNKEACDELISWFTCNIARLPVVVLGDIFLRKGIKTRMFHPCVQQQYNKTKNQHNAIRTCAKQLQAICENSPVRIIKTIRMEFSDVKHLLEELPNLKMVHLVRDPRATLLSQARMGRCNTKLGGRQRCTDRHCKRVENDIFEVEDLIKKYPDRIMPVMYENIAKYPLETSKKMYDFIGADFTLEAERYIYNITMAGNKNNCAICTTRSNSSEHVDTWKRKMKSEFLQIVNGRCNYILKHYKFEEFSVND